MAKFNNDIMPPSAPRMGNFVTRAIGEGILRLLGWRITGSLPDEKKLIIIGAPHTSNLDGILAVACMLSVGLKFSFMMKKEMFFFPLSGFFKALGGIPIDRSANTNMVDQMVDWFASHDKVWLGITPEGTRSNTKGFKKGYLYIARAAGVSVCIIGVDGATKRVVLDRVWPLTEDVEADNTAIEAYFAANFSGVKPARK